MKTLASRIGASMYRIVCLIRKEFWQLRQDSLYAAMLVFLPVLLMVLIVNVIGESSSSVYVLAVVDHDRSTTSRDLVAAMVNTQEISVRLTTASLDAANKALQDGTVAGILVVPAGFERDLLVPHRKVELLAVVDGTNVWAYRTTLGAMTGAVSRYGASLSASSGQTAAITLSPTRYNRSKHVHDAIASQFGFLLCMAILMVAAMGLAREREMGTLEQLLVTPLNRFELLLGKTMPALLVGLTDFWMLWLAGTFIWDMPTRGSLLLLFGMGILFILAETAWGLFLSSQAADQQQATQFILIQVMLELSFCGYIVPVDNLPTVLRWVSAALPLRHYLDSVRTIVLRGGDISDVAGSLGALLMLNAALWFISSRVLRRRLT